MRHSYDIGKNVGWVVIPRRLFACRFIKWIKYSCMLYK